MFFDELFCFKFLIVIFIISFISLSVKITNIQETTYLMENKINISWMDLFLISFI